MYEARYLEQTSDNYRNPVKPDPTRSNPISAAEVDLRVREPNLSDNTHSKCLKERRKLSPISTRYEEQTSDHRTNPVKPDPTRSNPIQSDQNRDDEGKQCATVASFRGLDALPWN